MITQLTLKRFKCFERLYMPFKPLTFIAGANGAGKSSIIQALLLLIQSCKDKDYDWKESLVINGELVELDNVLSLYYANSSSDEENIVISVENDDEDNITFSIAPKDVNGIANCITEGNLDNAKKNWPLFDENFVYLFADREHPKAKYSKTAKTRLDSRLGNKSANNVAFLLANEINNNAEIRLTELKHDNVEDCSILRNVSAWINHIMGGNAALTASEVEKDKEAKLVYSLSNKDGIEQQYSPLNMPFGHSYVLPIILAVLTAPKNSIIFIENPESHLHPSAQRRVGEFLARAAEAGIQIIIESHSDHLMNGIRIACKHGIINPENVEMDLIITEDDGYTHSRRTIKLNEDGSVKNLVPGFFDEWENALTCLIS